MILSGFLAESFQDWDKGLSSVVFTGKCNFRCPACYASKLLCSDTTFTEEEIHKKISRKAGYIKNIVICGGEATLESGLEDFIRALKNKGLSVKLDTNGSNPEVLKKLIDEKLIDHIAMDIKGPDYLYNRISGLNSYNSAENISKKVEQSLKIIHNAISYELRTTIVPVLRDEDEYSWLTPEECTDMTQWVYNLLNGQEPLWFLQRFTARTAAEMIDPKLSKESLPSSYWETPDNLLASIKDKASELNYIFKIR
jgi:pyruvate formate lyase activating enzyme